MTDPSDMEATVKRVQELSAQVVDKAKENGLAWLEGYERMLKNLLDLEEQAAKGSGMEWAATLASTHANFVTGDVGGRARRDAGAAEAGDQRQDDAHRAPRLSDGRLQGADDLQPVVRAATASTRSSCRWACKAEDYPAFLAALFRLTQHPRRAGDDAAQGDDRRRWSTRSAPTAQVAGACNAVLRRADGTLGRRPVRRRRLRARRRAQGLRRSPARVPGRRDRRRRLGDRRVARRRRRRRARCAVRHRDAARPTGSRGRLRQHYPDADGRARLATTPRATTSSSTRRRWA